MNYSFYFAIDLLPLGTVAAIEFTGPIVLALIGTKTLRNLLALGFTATGVYLLTEVRLTGEPMGFVWAFANALLFTFYIILAHRIAKVGGNTRPVDRLGASMMVAALVITPLGIQDALPAFTDGVLLLAGLGIGLFLIGDPLYLGPNGHDPAFTCYLCVICGPITSHSGIDRRNRIKASAHRLGNGCSVIRGRWGLSGPGELKNIR